MLMLNNLSGFGSQDGLTNTGSVWGSRFGNPGAPAPQTCVLTINTNGTMDVASSTGTSGTNDSGGTALNWYLPNKSGIGSNYWVKFTDDNNRATAGNMTENTWYQLSSVRSVGVTSTDAEETGTFYFSQSSGGAVLATITFAISADAGF